MLDDIGKADEGQSLNLADYAHEEVSDRVDQILDPNDSLRDVDKLHCRALAQSFCDYAFEYARGLMTIYISAAVNAAGAMYATTVRHLDGKNISNDDFRKVMLDGRPRRLSVELVRDGHHLKWAAEPFRAWYTFHINGSL